MPVILVKYEENDSKYDGSCFSEDTKYLVSVNGQSVKKDRACAIVATVKSIGSGQIHTHL